MRSYKEEESAGGNDNMYLPWLSYGFMIKDYTEADDLLWHDGPSVWLACSEFDYSINFRNIKFVLARSL